MDRQIRSRRDTTFTVSCWADVLACTQYSTEIARDAGFEERATWEIGIAVSELATNITRHVGSGTIKITRVEDPAPGLQIVATDSGPGIDDVDAAMTDDYSQGRMMTGTVPPGDRGGLGAGLGAVARFMDDVRIDSAPGEGTTVRTFKRLGSAPRSRAPKPILLLGLGNTLLSDDAVGIHVARHIALGGKVPGVDVREAEVAGFALLDLLEGYDHAVVVDAVRLRDGRPGEVVIFDGNGMDSSLHLVAGHQIDLPSAIELGRQLGRPVPNTVTIVGVQVEDDRTCSENCTPAVEAAIPEAARIALRLAAASQDAPTPLLS
jgi:hydrogenase maturation protease